MALSRTLKIHAAWSGKKRGNLERGSWEGGQTPACEDFRILIFILKPSKKALKSLKQEKAARRNELFQKDWEGGMDRDGETS